MPDNPNLTRATSDEQFRLGEHHRYQLLLHLRNVHEGEVVGNLERFTDAQLVDMHEEIPHRRDYGDVPARMLREFRRPVGS